MGSVGSVQLVPCSSLYFSRSIGPSNVVGINYRDFNLLHLSLPKWLPLFIWHLLFAGVFSVFSTLTQMGGHLFSRAVGGGG